MPEEMGQMFSRYTESAQNAIVRAQEEARRLHYGHVGTEHVLLGIIRVGDGIGYHVLKAMGIDPDRLRESVEHMIGFGEGAIRGEIRFTPNAKRVMTELCTDEAARLGHHWVGTEHILLGLLRENEGVAHHALQGAGLDLERLRAKVAELVVAGAERATLPSPRETPQSRLPIGRSIGILMGRAQTEAGALGSRAVELEHLILAALEDPDDTVIGGILREQGLTREWLVGRLQNKN